jgi:hypothetical protein
VTDRSEKTGEAVLLAAVEQLEKFSDDQRVVICISYKPEPDEFGMLFARRGIRVGDLREKGLRDVISFEASASRRLGSTEMVSIAPGSTGQQWRQSRLKNTSEAHHD